jgi:hypothetical protein
MGQFTPAVQVKQSISRSLLASASPDPAFVGFLNLRPEAERYRIDHVE